MAIDNSFDIYNATFNADKDIVESIVSAIKEQLETAIAEGTSTFDFETSSYTEDLPAVQRNRINDRVICILRDGGIRARMKGTPSLLTPDPSTSYPQYTPYFNNLMNDLTLMTITWYSRNDQEYMKTYC